MNFEVTHQTLTLGFWDPSAEKGGGSQHSSFKLALKPNVFNMVYLLPPGPVVSQIKDIVFYHFQIIDLLVFS